MKKALVYKSDCTIIALFSETLWSIWITVYEYLLVLLDRFIAKREIIIMQLKLMGK